MSIKTRTNALRLVHDSPPSGGRRGPHGLIIDNTARRLPRLLSFPSTKDLHCRNSSILGELIQRTLDSSSDANAGASLPEVQLPESANILHSLLTFIFPVTPLLPPTPEDIMNSYLLPKSIKWGQH
ncbi:hypothetical protein BJV77DRAFT_1017400 [Russula vinacea]|nr:hypothetical protein BJV77DRAFT_1017400 [Russula vinacea]